MCTINLITTNDVQHHSMCSDTSGIYHFHTIISDGSAPWAWLHDKQLCVGW